MNYLDAKKETAVLLFNGLKAKMAELESAVHCRHYRIGHDNEYTDVKFMGDKIYVRIGKGTVARVSADECAFFKVFCENVEGTVVINALLTLAVVFSGEVPFKFTIEHKLITAVIDDYKIFYKVDSIAEAIVNGFAAK